jgi:hypothetical protein
LHFAQVPQEPNASVTEALSLLTPPEGLIVEAWVGAQSASDLTQAATNISRNAPWLRLRKVGMMLHL